MSYLVELIFDEYDDELGVLRMVAGDICDLAEGHYAVEAKVIDDGREHARDLQAAVDRAHGALASSAYVGGPSEREAWQTALRALGEVVTVHQGANPDATGRAAPEGGKHSDG